MAARQQLRTRTPEPVTGRKHVDIQTELYLEELSDRVPVSHTANQTDAFLDRPPSPFFIPASTGQDADTQIYANDVRIYSGIDIWKVVNKADFVGTQFRVQ